MNVFVDNNSPINNPSPMAPPQPIQPLGSPPITPPSASPPPPPPAPPPPEEKKEEVITFKPKVKPRLLGGGLLPKLLPLGIITVLVAAVFGATKLMPQKQAPPKAIDFPEPCSCDGTSLYNTSNQPLAPDNVTPGQTVRIGFKTISTKVWKARCKVNSGEFQELTNANFSPAIGYYFDYTIPAGGGTFTFRCQACCECLEPCHGCAWIGE